jgi:uncharacterized protein YjaZ
LDIDFKTIDHRCSKERGVTHFEGKGRIIIYLQHHETIEDIYATITHELIHHLLYKYKHVEIDDYQEHDLIFNVQWIDEYVS